MGAWRHLLWWTYAFFLLMLSLIKPILLSFRRLHFILKPLIPTTTTAYILHVFSSQHSLFPPKLLLQQTPLVELAFLVRPQPPLHALMLSDDVGLQLLDVFQLKGLVRVLGVVDGQELVLLKLEFISNIHDKLPLGIVDSTHIRVQVAAFLGFQLAGVEFSLLLLFYYFLVEETVFVYH